MNAQDYNIEYFRFIRDEITKRIQIHFKLEIVKFGLVGGALAFLLKTPSPISVSPFLVPAILAFLVDITILGNLGWIRSAGAYVKQNIENNDAQTINWEHDFAQSGGKWACFSPIGYLCGIWSIGFALVLSEIYFWRCENVFNPPDGPLLIIACCLVVYTLYLIKVNLGKGKKNDLTKRKITESFPPMQSLPRKSPIC